MAQCKYCGAEIWFLYSKRKDKYYPVDGKDTEGMPIFHHCPELETGIIKFPTPPIKTKTTRRATVTRFTLSVKNEFLYAITSKDPELQELIETALRDNELNPNLLAILATVKKIIEIEVT